MIDAAAVAKDLAAVGVAGVQIAWADNNGIPRSRIVPIDGLPAAATRGVGVTTLFPVFDSHDGITFEHAGLGNASGDVRLVPVLEGLQRLPGQPALAWAPGRLLTEDGAPWPYDQRGALQRQVELAEQRGYRIRAGYELEFVLCSAQVSDVVSAPGHHGPAYSPHALLEVDEFIAAVLGDAAGAGLELGQLHAEFGMAQVELSLAATDPLTAADQQLLARQVVRAAARAHGLRACFAPMVTADGVGNGWHLHTSVYAGERNLLAGDERGPGEPGAGYLAGLLRDLPAITAITAPSVPSSSRLRPGFFSSAYQFWGVHNREAALRYVPSSTLLGADAANVELKPSDASANPHLSLAVVIAAGLAGMADGLTLPAPIAAEPSGWPEADRAGRGVHALPDSPQQQADALAANQRIGAALGPELLGAFRAVRAADVRWASRHSPEEIVAAHRWLY